MNKIIIFAGILVLYFIFKGISDIKDTDKLLQRDVENIMAINSLLRDKLEIKDNEIAQRQYEIKRYNINYEAFNGTACQTCHLDSNNLFPYKDKKPLSLQEYINVVRNGIEGSMPKYENRPNKGPRDITDSELRRQYNILKTLYNKDIK